LKTNPVQCAIFDILRAGYTQVRIAKVCRTSSAQLSRYTCGDRIPNVGIVSKLCIGFPEIVDATELLTKISIWYDDKRKNANLPRTKVKSVVKLDKDGNFVERFDSVKEASWQVGISSSAISNCINKRQDSAAGFMWNTEEEYNHRKRYETHA